VTEPFSVRWKGFSHLERDTELVLRVRGLARLRIDGVLVAEIDSPSAPDAAHRPVRAGDGVWELEYLKPANVEGVLSLHERAGTDLGRPFQSVATSPQPGWRWSTLPVWFALAWMAHVAAAAAALWWLGPAVVRRLRWIATLPSWSQRIDDLAAPTVITLFVLQGIWQGARLVGHVWTLTGGDDWSGFENNARDIVLNGLMMTEGAIVGRGQPFFYYPGYPYFVAAVHAISGESLATPIFANFALLGAATAVVHRLARLLLGVRPALFALAWVIVLEQIAFARHYTVTLLSENLFVPATAITVTALSRWFLRDDWKSLAVAGIAGGVSALTRPSMMLFLPLAMLVMCLARVRVAPARALLAPVIFATLWLAAVAPATIRNYLMSERVVLIASGGHARSFIEYNMPPENQQWYEDMFDGSFASAAVVLAQMLIDQPVPFLTAVAKKVGFSLGMVHWQGGRVHPELVLTSALYLLAIIVVPAARSIAAAPIHLFVFTHLATLTLTIPWNYGYRMILPMYPLMAVLAVSPFMRRSR
jgi:hypothetical protein